MKKKLARALARPTASLKVLRFVVPVFAIALIAAGQEVLTNESIVRMVKAGLGESLIVEMVGNHPGNYDLTADSLAKLKQQGVSDPVLTAMMAKGGTPPASVPTTPVQNEQPAAATIGPPCPLKSGVYYFDGSGWKAMSGVLMAGSGTKVTPIPIFTSAKVLARFRDPAAPVTLNDRPRFCVSGSSFSRNLVIASLEVKGDHREIQMAGGHALTGVKSGIPEKKIQPTEITQVSDSVVEVSVKRSLAPGQYILFPRGSESGGYDFGVKPGDN